MPRPIKYVGAKEYIEELCKSALEKIQIVNLVENKFQGISEKYIYKYINKFRRKNPGQSAVKKERVAYMMTIKDLPRRQVLDKMVEKFDIKEGTAIGYYTEYLATRRVKKKGVRKPNTKMKRCIMCHDDFETEVDKMGVPYKCRCPECTDKLKNDRLNIAAMARVSR